jgi:hypothetical protein
VALLLGAALARGGALAGTPSTNGVAALAVAPVCRGSRSEPLRLRTVPASTQGSGCSVTMIPRKAVPATVTLRCASVSLATRL